MAEVGGRPAAFASVIHNPHKGKNTGWWREHRTVCLPDFQGVGIGNALSEFVGGLMVATGKEYRSTTSHPSMIRHRNRSPLWKMFRKPSLTPPGGQLGTGCGMGATQAWDRMTAGFEFIGPANHADAKAFGII